MNPALYDELTPWYRLLDPLDDHAAEVAEYVRALDTAISPAPRTLLELGAGAGNNGYFLSQHYSCTLTDLSEPMLQLSRELNPGCRHVPGDMRTLRLDETFDAVLVHDAVSYMTTLEDLAAAATTAFVHLRPGGAALFLPDCLRESFREQTDEHGGEDGNRAFRCIEWMWDPDPDDSTYTVDYAFLFRDETGVKAVHERHVEGLFSRTDWLRVLSGAGFLVSTETWEVATDGGERYSGEMFVCRRP